MGLTQSAEKLRSLTQSNAGWEDYRAAGRLLYESFGNLFSVAHANENSNEEANQTREAGQNPIIYVSNHLSNSIVISASSVGIVQQVLSTKIVQWLMPVKITGNHQQTYRGPDPAAGFRIFMEVVERFSKLNLLF